MNKPWTMAVGAYAENMVADAVVIEPVSVSKFPDNRENAGNFNAPALILAKGRADKPHTSWVKC